MRISKAQALASKQYISIIRLFHRCDIATGDDFNLSRAKKQLQAEFSIAQGGFIEVDGYSYNRHDVIEEIERPDFPSRLVFHKMIWQSRQILQLLEKNTANLSTIRNEFKPFWNNKDFDNFFSPYFAGPFNYLSRTLLAEMKLTDMGELLRYEDFLQPAEKEEAFRPIRLFLDENIRTLRNVNGANYKIMRPKISHWIQMEWYLFFNHLPHEFYEKKNEITTMIINIGVAVQKTHRRDCKKMSEQLISLQGSPESLRDVIVSNHAIYNKSSGSFNWRGGWWVIWIIIMLIRAAGAGSCNDKSYNNSYFREIPYQISDSTLRRFASDSNLKRQLDTLSEQYVPSARLRPRVDTQSPGDGRK